MVEKGRARVNGALQNLTEKPCLKNYEEGKVGQGRGPVKVRRPILREEPFEENEEGSLSGGRNRPASPWRSKAIRAREA